MKIYFAASIRGGRDDQKLYIDIIKMLKKYGEVLTEHIGSKDLLEQGEIEMSDNAIFARDCALLDQCDIIVAEVTNPSLGVGYEIGRMENKKPVLCLYRQQDGRRLSAMLAGNNNLLVANYKNLKDIETALENFFRKI